MDRRKTPRMSKKEMDFVEKLDQMSVDDFDEYLVRMSALLPPLHYVIFLGRIGFCGRIKPYREIAREAGCTGAHVEAIWKTLLMKVENRYSPNKVFNYKLS